MDERRRYNLLHAIDTAQSLSDRPVNLAEVQSAYSEGRAASEPVAVEDIKWLVSVEDVVAEFFRDAENVKRVQRIAITPSGRKFLCEMKNMPRSWLSEKRRWVIGTLIAILAIIPSYLALRPKDDSVPLVTHNVSSFNQSGGVTAHTVVVPDAPARHLTDELRSDLDRKIGSLENKNKPVVIEALLGNNEALQYAEEIKRYLLERGREVEGIHPTAWAFPKRGVQIRATDDKTILVQVGSNE